MHSLPAKGCCCKCLKQVSWLTDHPTPCAFPAVRPVAFRRFRPRSQLRSSTGLTPASLTPGCLGSHLLLKFEPSCEGLQRLPGLALMSPDEFRGRADENAILPCRGDYSRVAPMLNRFFSQPEMSLTNLMALP